MTDTESVDTEALESVVKRLPDEPEPEKDEKTKAPDADEASQDDQEPEAAEAEEADEDAGEDEGSDDSDEEGEERPKPKRQSAQARIAELTRLRHEADRRAQAAEREAAALREAAKPPAEEPQGPPKPEDFPTYDEYTSALVKHEAKALFQQEMAGLGKNATEIARQQAEKAAAARWNEKAAAATAKYQDFEDVTQSPALQITSDSARYLADHDQGADIAYYLGTHLSEASEIATLPPMQQAARFERIAARLTAKPPPKQSAAPDPVKPVKASRPAARPKTPDRARSFKEYEQIRLGQAKQK